MKKTILLILVILIFATILYLTFQDGEHTTALSTGLQAWLKDHGIDVPAKRLRSDAHYVEYFLLGLALALFGKAMGIRLWWMVLIGCGLGLFDETVKILLPIREFELIDLLKDWVAIFASTGCVKAIGRRTHE